MSSEQAPWVKVGVPVRRKASGFLHSRGEIVEVDGGLGVRCPTIQTVKRDDDIAASWEACALDPSSLKSEQAAWLKEGTDVRWKGGGQHGTRGTIVKVSSGLAVRYAGEALVWSGNIAESWAPCEVASLPVAAQPVMLDGGLCAKPEAPDGIDQLDRRLSEALWLYRDKPTSAATFGALQLLWDLLTAQFGAAWSRARGDVCGDHVGRVRSEACYVCKAGPMEACGSTAAPVPASFKIKPGTSWSDILKTHPPVAPVQAAVGTTMIDLNHIHAHGEQASRPVSTMEQVIARLDAIEAALMPLVHLALDAEGRVIAVPPISPTTTPATKLADDGTGSAATQGHCESAQPTDHARLPTAPPNVPVHSERYAAAREAMYYDTYGAACPRCKAPRWGGCVAVDGEPTDVTPEEVVRVRVDRADIGPVFRHISRTSDQLALVARGLFEVCAVLVPRSRDALRPGLLPVARTWESLNEEERDFWRGSVENYLDGTDEERTMSPVEWAALGAMVRVFGLERKA